MNLEALKSFVAEIFVRLGVPEAAARLSAAALVTADVEGMPAHGLRLVPVYVERILAGSVSTETEPKLVHDGGSSIVVDAGNMLGQLSSDWAIPMVSERAREHGLACIAVRNAAHFGTARFWARQIAEGGLVGLALSSGRPLKSAVAAALALPSADTPPYVVDLQTNGAAADPAAAIARMLLPTDRTKTLRLATAVELVCGGLAGGALGAELGAFEGDSAQACGASHLFLAVDPARFGIADLAERVASHAPNNLASPARHCHEAFAVAPELVAKLNACAVRVGVERVLE